MHWTKRISGIAAVLALFAPAFAQAQTGLTDTVTPEEFLSWKDDFKTWGRWGPDDRKGMSNLITPEKVREATALVREGVTISLAHPEPQTVAADVGENGLFYRTTNVIRDTGTSDTYRVSYHGLTVSHMDTWCHRFFDGHFYNGIPVEGNLDEEHGCAEGSVMIWKNGVTTRAVLYDIPRLKGVEWLEPGEVVTRADLEAFEEMSGVRAGPGDVVVLYTARWKRRAAMGAWRDAVPGYYVDTVPWMHEREPAFIAHDFNIDWGPRPGWDEDHGIRGGGPIHEAVLHWMGINILECLDLEEAVEKARELNRYEFLITWAPLPVEGGSGSPVNPLAIF